MSDYAIPYQRRSKRDLQRKRKNRVYKRGGSFRGINLSKDTQEDNSNKKDQQKN